METNENFILNQFPNSLEAEQSVLGAILLEPKCFDKVSDILTSESFYYSKHKEIYSIFVEMDLSSQKIDFITILNEVLKRGIFSTEGEAKVYLTQLIQIVPVTNNIEDYAMIVQEKYIRRSLIISANEIISHSQDISNDSSNILNFAEQKIYEIRQGKNKETFKEVGKSLVSTFDRLQKLGSKDKEKYLGIATGFKDLDDVLTGLNRSDLIILAARPGMGKTAFALNIALNVAKQGKKVAIFSLEMSNEQLTERFLSSESFVKSDSMRKGALTSDDWVKIAVASQRLSKLPIYLDDTAGLSISDIKSKVRRQKDISFVIIDYLQLINTSNSGRRSENRVQEVSEMTRALKIMAKELNIPVLVLSQLSRSPDSREDKRPRLSDLRESGSIEQDADSVLFLYRETYYTKENKEPDFAECIIAKNRHGETSNVKLIWDGKYTRFFPIDYIHEN